ncbi:hypothetical protein [Helicobacter sp. T3_23-1056]
MSEKRFCQTMKIQNTKMPFDPLLFDGLGSDRDRKWNNIIYSTISSCGATFAVFGLYIFYGVVVEKWHHNTWFICSYFVIMIVFCVFLCFWIYWHLLLFKNGKKHKHINKNNPILVCEYKRGFGNYCVWIFGFIIVAILYSPVFVLSIFIQPFIAPVLLHLFLSKPFLLKKILLFDKYVILEYRIFGNIKLSRERLVLMRMPAAYKNLAFVRPQLFDKDKYPHIIANFCTRFNPFGMSNVDKLIEILDSEIEYNVHKIRKDMFIINMNPNIINFNVLKKYLKSR